MKPATSNVAATGRSSDQRTAPAVPVRQRGRALVWFGAGIATGFLLAVVVLGAVGLWLASKTLHGVGSSDSPLAGGPVKPPDGGGAQPISSGPRANDAPADKPAAGVVWGGGYKNGDGVTLEVTDVTRTDDGLLKASFRVRNATDKPVTVWSDLAKLYCVDPNTKASYPIMCNTKGNILPFNRDRVWENGEPLASHSTAWIHAPPKDVSRTYWAKLQRPDDAVQKVAFYFNDFEPIEGVPLPPVKN